MRLLAPLYLDHISMNFMDVLIALPRDHVTRKSQHHILVWQQWPWRWDQACRSFYCDFIDTLLTSCVHIPNEDCSVLANPKISQTNVQTC